MTTVETSGALRSRLGDIAAPEDEQIVAKIERILSAEFKDYLTAEKRREIARNDANIAAEQSRGARETVMVRVAKFSHEQNWSADDVKDAVKHVIDRYAGNDKKKASSVATFKSEIMLASDRKVRPHVAGIFDLAREAFTRETEAKAANEDAPTPIRKAFARQYHAAVAALKHVRDKRNVVFDTTEDMTAFAIKTIRDRQIDYARVKKRLDAICAELGAFYKDFPVGDISVCVDFLKEITEDKLEEARRSATSETGADGNAEVETSPETHDDETEGSSTPADKPTGLGDMLNDALSYGAAA